MCGSTEHLARNCSKVKNEEKGKDDDDVDDNINNLFIGTVTEDDDMNVTRSNENENNTVKKQKNTRVIKGKSYKNALRNERSSLTNKNDKENDEKEKRNLKLEERGKEKNQTMGNEEISNNVIELTTRTEKAMNNEMNRNASKNKKNETKIN